MTDTSVLYNVEHLLLRHEAILTLPSIKPIIKRSSLGHSNDITADD